MKKILLLAFCTLFTLAGCRKTDVRHFDVVCPTMTSNDIPAVRQALGRYQGVRLNTLKYSPDTHTLHLQYDSMMLAKKNIEMAIAELGFPANGITIK